MKTKTEAMKEYSESIKGNFDYTVESGHLTGFSAGWEACEKSYSALEGFLNNFLAEGPRNTWESPVIDMSEILKEKK